MATRPIAPGRVRMQRRHDRSPRPTRPRLHHSAAAELPGPDSSPTKSTKRLFVPAGRWNNTKRSALSWDFTATAGAVSVHATRLSSWERPPAPPPLPERLRRHCSQPPTPSPGFDGIVAIAHTEGSGYERLNNREFVLRTLGRTDRSSECRRRSWPWTHSKHIRPRRPRHQQRRTGGLSAHA